MVITNLYKVTPSREGKIELLEDKMDSFPWRGIDIVVTICVSDVWMRVIVLWIVGWHYNSTYSRDLRATPTSLCKWKNNDNINKLKIMMNNHTCCAAEYWFWQLPGRFRSRNHSCRPYCYWFNSAWCRGYWWNYRRWWYRWSGDNSFIGIG